MHKITIHHQGGTPMNWTSVKNLLIAILVAANLFLIYNVVRQERTRGYIDENEIRGAVELLSKDGLTVGEDKIPREKFKAPVYESIYSDEYYTEAAEALSGSKREMLYTLPEGGISITTEDGSAFDFDTEFGFRYVSFDISDASAYTDITADNFYLFSKTKAEPVAKHLKNLSERAAEFLDKQLHGDDTLEAMIKASCYDAEKDITYLLASQVLDGYEVYSHFAICVFEGEKLVYAHGRWYFADLDDKYSTELRDQVNILFTNLETLKEETLSPSGETGENTGSDSDETKNIAPTTVSSISPCYIIYWNSEKTSLFFIPAWQIDHIGDRTFVYNAANGTVYSSDQ